MLGEIRDLFLKGSAFILVGFAAFSANPSRCYSQTAGAVSDTNSVSREILIDTMNSSVPLQLDSLKVGEKTVTAGVYFEASDAWLGDITVDVKNVSKKTITRVEVIFTLLDTGDGTSAHPCLTFGAVVGLRPEHALTSKFGFPIPQSSGPAIALPPGLSLVAHTAGAYAEMKKTIVARQPLSSIKRVRLSIGGYFSDGTRWVDDAYYRPDLDRPGQYLSISYEEFSHYSAPH
jgi:hypothetical protein